MYCNVLIVNIKYDCLDLYFFDLFDFTLLLFGTFMAHRIDMM